MEKVGIIVENRFWILVVEEKNQKTKRVVVKKM